MNLLPGFSIFVDLCSLMTGSVEQGARGEERRVQSTGLPPSLPPSQKLRWSKKDSAGNVGHKAQNRNNKVSPGRRWERLLLPRTRDRNDSGINYCSVFIKTWNRLISVTCMTCMTCTTCMIPGRSALGISSLCEGLNLHDNGQGRGTSSRSCSQVRR